MEQIARIFDYFKRTYSLNTKNKQLYYPQTSLILLKTIFYVISGLILYKVMASINVPGFSYEMLRYSAAKTFGLGFLMILIHWFLAMIVEAGLFNMYKSCIQHGSVVTGSFGQGIRKYAFKFFLINILTFIGWGLIIVPYILVGFVTLFAGFVLVPFIIAVFTSMWKVSMVMEDRKIIESLKTSFQFGKTHFLPLSVLVMFQRAFSGLPKGSGSFNSNSGNWNSNYNPSSTTGDLTNGIENVDFSFLQWYGEVFQYIKVGFFILIPVVSVAVLIASLIKMIFEVFFSLAIFIMYDENVNDSNKELSKEVL